MSFHSLADFLAMGGHGPFVWSAYGLSFVVLLLNLVWPVMMTTRNMAALRRDLSVADPDRAAEHKGETP
jgi:heme exporter protein D